MRSLRGILGQRIRELRKAKGMSQTELAEKSGTSLTTIASIENSNSGTNIDLLEKIAQSLGMQPHELLKMPSQTKGNLGIPRDLLTRLAAADEGELEDIRLVFRSHDKSDRDFDSSLVNRKEKERKKS